MNRARLFLFLMLGYMSNPVLCGVDVPPRFSSQQITGAEWNELYEKTKEVPGASIQLTQWHVVITAPAPAYISTYVFTRPGHPAHPAVVIHDVLEIESGHVAQVSSYFAGSRPRFQAWEKKFRFTAYALYPPLK
jgi:hypothetical protein